ncbi:methyltransferase domain-containing protein [Knoellia koreensis]|uniref:methyltransferase domain-containing protein n=1 Tax=Knoellia koreensis TaxID=2730921 RepID=UPI0019812783
MTDEELDHIRERYERRKTLAPDLYSFTRPEVLRGVQSVDRATMSLLVGAGLTDLAGLRLLEVGCGTGGNLLRFLRWGFRPENLVGNDLLADRVEQARRVLPRDVTLTAGDARDLDDGGPFDIVYQSTVLSSILDDEVQRSVADRMWQLTRPGGVVLSYDFVFDNPRNPDVRKVPVSRLRQLFPEGMVTTRRVTLAPPIARRAARLGPAFSALEALPFLRTHVVALISKPT